MIKRIIFLTLLLGFQAFVNWGQKTDVTAGEQLSNISIPSPVASGIQQFTDVPVSYYTGSPQISIPIYEINSGSLKLPITLSYHGGGIKVGQHAGNVGLGWTLCAEGSVSKQVLGVEDNGTYQQNGLNFTNAVLDKNVNADFQTLLNLSNNAFDGVPDLYLYNFGGQSGRFVNADQIRLLPQANIQFSSYIKAGNQPCFKAVAQDGTQYFFEDKETTVNKSATAASPSNSWFLTKIVDANNIDSIIFQYENTVEEVGIGANFQKLLFPPTLPGGGLGPIPDAPGPGDYSGFVTDVNGKQLKRILFSNGSVEYDLGWNDRQDVSTGSAAIQAPRIKNIFIKDKDGAIIKTIHFEQDYFISPGTYATTPQGKYLRLASMSFVPNLSSLNTPIEEKYTFTYNSQNLPHKKSYAQDHWGYYNGANNNTTLIPEIHLPNFDYSLGDGAANREPSATSVKAGMLEQITWPTGGWTRFDWEINKVYNGIDSILVYADSVIAIDLASTGPEVFYYSDDEILVPTTGLFAPTGPAAQGMAGTFNVSMVIPPGSGSLQINNAGAQGRVHEKNGTNPETVKDSKTFTFTNTNPYFSNINMIPGRKYRLWGHIQGNGFGLHVQLTAHWPKKILNPDPYEKVGGCRIAKISNYDPASKDTTYKSYTYEDGKIFFRPLYWKYANTFYDPDNTPDGTPGAPSCDDEVKPGLFISSNSIYSQGSGTHVGYNKVTETLSGGGGKTEYTFENFNDGASIGDVEAAWRKGIPTGKKVYNNVGAAVSGVTYHNRYGSPIVRYAGHTASLTAQHECATLITYNSLYPVFFDQKVYDFPSEWIITDTIKNTDYVMNLSTLTVNGYDNPQHKEITQSATFNSDGSKLTTFFKYPTDFTLSGLPASDEATAIKVMQDKHMHSVVLEKYVQKVPSGSSSPLTIAASYTGYKDYINDIILPFSNYSIDIPAGVSNFQPINMTNNVVNKDSRYTLKSTAAEYNLGAQMLTLSMPGNNYAGYIWGYNNAFPIAKAANSSATKTRGFTSFEKNATGNWIYSEAGTVTTNFFTGKRAYSLVGYVAAFDFANNSDLLTSNPNPNPIPGKYIVSYWRKSGSVTVNGANPTLVGWTTPSGWTYCEHLLTDPTSVSVNGNTLIDELRFYPAEAQMK